VRENQTRHIEAQEQPENTKEKKSANAFGM